jgi:hypothetical protein
MRTAMDDAMKSLLPLLLFASCAFAADGEPVYSIKRDQSASHVRKDAVKATLPLNKSWAELTPEEQGRVRRLYDTMAPGDEPPFPLAGMESILEHVAQVRSRTRVTGQLAIFVDIDASGEPVAATIQRAPDADYAKAVALILMKTPFKPATCSGAPCAMTFPFRMTVTN